MTYQDPWSAILDRQAQALIWLLVSLPSAGLIQGYSPLIYGLRFGVLGV